MEALVAAADEVALAGETTALATRVAAICDKIKEHRDAGKPMSVRRAAVIAAMIDDIAATNTEGMPPRAGRKKARKGSVRWYEEVSRLNEGKSGVVVKSFRPSCGDNDVGDILREACFMAGCRGHPSIIGYRGVTLTQGSKDEYSLVVDHVGPSLAEVIQDRGRPFPEADVRRIMRHLLGATKAMEERGIVHRDIKPANILLAGSGSGAVKISDFSVAKSMAEKKEAPTLFAGTNGYTAPEMLLWNMDHGTPVDAWSLGCVMMELLVHELPFAGENEADQLYRIFDVLGVPGKKVWLALKPRAVLNDDGEVQRRRARQRRLGHRNQLRELFPEHVLSQDGFEVLDVLLTCDPTKRLTPGAALRCPWFSDDVDDAPVLSAVVWKTAGAVTKSCALVLQMAVSVARRALGLLGPKAVIVM